jgi:hypothetical protein
VDGVGFDGGIGTTGGSYVASAEEDSVEAFGFDENQENTELEELESLGFDGTSAGFGATEFVTAGVGVRRDEEAKPLTAGAGERRDEEAAVNGIGFAAGNDEIGMGGGGATAGTIGAEYGAPYEGGSKENPL